VSAQAAIHTATAVISVRHASSEAPAGCATSKYPDVGATRYSTSTFRSACFLLLQSRNNRSGCDWHKASFCAFAELDVHPPTSSHVHAADENFFTQPLVLEQDLLQVSSFLKAFSGIIWSLTLLVSNLALEKFHNARCYALLLTTPGGFIILILFCLHGKHLTLE